MLACFRRHHFEQSLDGAAPVSSRVQEILAAVMAANIDGGGLPWRLCMVCEQELVVNGVGISLTSDYGLTGLLAATSC
jgi:hypothetical protein